MIVRSSRAKVGHRQAPITQRPGQSDRAFVIPERPADAVGRFAFCALQKCNGDGVSFPVHAAVRTKLAQMLRFIFGTFQFPYCRDV